MPNFGYRCEECKTEFEIYGLTADERVGMKCVECKSEKLETISFDDTEKGILSWIAAELRRANKRLDDILDGEALTSEQDEPTDACSKPIVH